MGVVPTALVHAGSWICFDTPRDFKSSSGCRNLQTRNDYGVLVAAYAVKRAEIAEFCSFVGCASDIGCTSLTSSPGRYFVAYFI